ncbi:MAG: PadR family transcriptional regulator, partial [Acidobacteria bacterium]|nr:PadR family transcriptional regulator [Acidobacteriota bacterium]
IARRSDDVLQVEQGSLYPALQRLEDRGWIDSFWGTSDANRRARFYKLTPAGKKQLAAEATRWEQLARAVKRVMRPV